MPRPLVTVRPATVDDVPALVELWQEVVEESGPAGRTGEPPTVEAVRHRVAALAEDRDRELLVALDDGEPVALAHLVNERLTPLHETPAVRLSYFHVSSTHRRRGFGTALLTSAAAWAEQAGAEHVIADCNPAARETNRFFARLGFGQLFVLRAVPLPVLLRRLAAGPSRSEGAVAAHASLRARARGTVSVVARGRARRTRVASVGAPSEL